MVRRQTSSSPKKWLKVLAWTLGSLAVLFVIAIVGAKGWINSYLGSPEFLRRMARHSSEEMRARVEISPVRFDGSQFFSDGLQATGGPEANFSDLKITNVRGEFRLPTLWGLLSGDRKVGIDNVDVQHVEANFFDDRIALDLPPHKKREHRGDLGKITVRELRLGWRGGRVSGMGVTATQVERGWQVAGQGGRVMQNGLPSMDIVSMRLVHKEPSLFIQEARLREDGGEISATGEVTAKEKVDLQFKVSGVNVTPLLPEDWRARLHGRISGDARLMYSLREGTGAARVLSGNALLQQGALEALPVLNKIAEFTKTDRFRRLALNQVRGDFRVDDNGLRVTNFVLESERLISVKGQFTIVNDQIDGTFEVGITPGPLQWLPGSQEKVFVTQRDGYAWTTMRITGPVDGPKEDLSSRLVAAAEAAVVQKVESTANQAVGTAVDTVKKGATGVLELLFGP
jgi:hypothetical protein